MVNKMKLSKRLETALRLGYGPIIADVGCDHAKLAIQAVLSGQASHAYAIDNKVGPLAIARENIRLAGLENHISLQLSFGLEALCSPIDTCYLLGMGGLTIRDILKDPNRTWVNQFILGAHSEITELRLFLSQEGYTIREEECLEEDGKFYVLMAVIKAPSSYTNEQLEFGPILLIKKPKPWIKWLRKKHDIYVQAMSETSDSDRIQSLLTKLEQIRRILNECN